ncbi:unnamed protein product [Peniophora sp. CBMAI 1063]|nr:unnamed protein product [Peniophora sp. CBMAI 1063]
MHGLLRQLGTVYMGYGNAKASDPATLTFSFPIERHSVALSMVDWKADSTETADVFRMEAMSLVVIGIYIHELIYSMSFDMGLFSRREEEERSLMAKCVKAGYLSCRYCALISAIAELYVVFRAGRGSLACGALMKLSAVQCFHLHAEVPTSHTILYQGAAAISSTCCSALIAVRAAAVWAWDTRIVTLVAISCLAAFGTDLHISFSLSSSYDTEHGFCTLIGEHSNLPNMFTLLLCDTVLLACLLTGLYRWHQPTKGAHGFRLWSVLWNQGVLYLALASVTEVPALVFLFLNLNPAMNVIFTRPLTVILVLAATRFHRSLHAFTPNKTRHEYAETIRFAAVDIGSR